MTDDQDDDFLVALSFGLAATLLTGLAYWALSWWVS